MSFRWKNKVALTVLLSSCLVSRAADKEEIVTQDTTLLSYANPVFEPVLADPTVVRDPRSKLFYAFGTADNWGDGQGTRWVPMLASRNLRDWKYVKDALVGKPTWKKEGGVWAPDVNAVNGKYYMYYAFSTWGDPNPGIGLAIADSLPGDFVDQGKVFLSEEVDVPNSIDPCFFQDEDKKYLFWGSFSELPTQGTYAVELTADGKSAVDLNKKTKIAGGDWEAVMIHKRGDYYYFFGSKGSCCEGIDSKYHVLVARSKQVLGPYLDRNGQAITKRGKGTLLLKGNDHFVGTGHNAQIITDDEGADWLLYHGFAIQDGNLANGTNRRVLLLDRLNWENDWPVIKNQGASAGNQKAPVFH